jgi:hypothetical protein
LSRLTEDVDYVLSEKGEFIVCVDNADLYRYLTLRDFGLSYSGASGAHRLVSERVSVMLMCAYPKPIVLLPDYYKEFRKQLVNLREESSGFHAEDEARRLSARLRALVMGDGARLGLVDLAERLKIARKMEDLSAARSAAEDVLELLDDISSVVSLIPELERVNRRFDELMSHDRLVPPAEYDLPVLSWQQPSRYANRLRKLFDRSRPGMTISNGIDSRALAQVLAWDQDASSPKRRIVLTSSSPSMLGVAQSLAREVVGLDEDRVPVRSMRYWKVWWSIVGGSGSRVKPERGRLDQLTKKLQPRLRDLEEQLQQACESLSEGDSVSGRANLESQAEASAMAVRSLDSVVDRVLLPMLSESARVWEGTMATRVGLKKLSIDVTTIVQLREDLHTIVTRAYADKTLRALVSSAVSVIDGLVSSLHAYARTLEGKIDSDLRVVWADKLLGYPGAETEKVRSHYRALVHDLEQKDAQLRQDWANAFLQQDRESSKSLGAGLLAEWNVAEFGLLRARARLVLGDWESARSELESIEATASNESEYGMLLALLRIDAGDYRSAWGILERVIQVRDDVYVRVLRAKVLAGLAREESSSSAVVTALRELLLAEDLASTDGERWIVRDVRGELRRL